MLKDCCFGQITNTKWSKYCVRSTKSWSSSTSPEPPLNRSVNISKSLGIRSIFESSSISSSAAPSFSQSSCSLIKILFSLSGRIPRCDNNFRMGPTRCFFQFNFRSFKSLMTFFESIQRKILVESISLEGRDQPLCSSFRLSNVTNARCTSRNWQLWRRWARFRSSPRRRLKVRSFASYFSFRTKYSISSFSVSSSRFKKIQSQSNSSSSSLSVDFSFDGKSGETTWCESSSTILGISPPFSVVGSIPWWGIQGESASSISLRAAIRIGKSYGASVLAFFHTRLKTRSIFHPRVTGSTKCVALP